MKKLELIVITYLFICSRITENSALRKAIFLSPRRMGERRLAFRYILVCLRRSKIIFETIGNLI
jgi:hypothetical protein